MTVQATVLCENAVYGNLGARAEHGWSVWIETEAASYLFDTGQGTTHLHNAGFLRKDVATADAILVSHHHSDHTGGLLDAVKVIARRSSASVPVYAHPDLFKNSYFSSKDTLTFVGLPHTRRALETAGADFRLDTGWREVADGLFMTGEVPRRTTFEHPDPGCRHEDEQSRLVLDPIRDDQTVVIDTPSGLFVILGCAHAGIVNILTYITERTGKARFHTIMGGTHLAPAGEEQVERTIAALMEHDIERIGVSHCTGQKVAVRMAQAFGERFFFCSVGTQVTVE
jgi:7,8-dihydropterin-6-yl-methyl-4-(beta-D-ribofuranosyl)aminobenzene 5'-phosphate synthase